MSDLYKYLETAPSAMIADAFVITNNKLGSYKKVAVSISGGSDSDIMLDLVSKFDSEKKVKYVFFDTGLEYAATKEHLQDLEKKYGITIDVEKAAKPIPTACKQYGQPFLSKRVSNMIKRLQSNGFQWENEDFETLYKKYPKCKVALMWWCNNWGKSEKGYNSQFNIANNKWLKEFMLENPPDFKISDECCSWAKKKPAHKYKKANGIELSLQGVRKSEGGNRGTIYKSCFSDDVKGVAEYRPIFWLKDDDKELYKKRYGVTYSRCYSEYGLKRTGCAGCPFGRDFEAELQIIKEYEPKLYKAVNKIFGNSYEYTRKYREFVRNKEEVVICRK